MSLNQFYVEIVLKEALPDLWAEWFSGLRLSVSDGATCLSGPVADQAALHGLLERIRDLNLSLVSVQVRDIPLPDRSGNAGQA